MPRISTYGAPWVGPVQTTNARFRAADNGGGVAGGIADGLRRVGQSLSGYADEQDRMYDRLAQTQADSLYVNAATSATTMLADYKTKAGQDALTSRPSVDKALEDTLNSVLSKADPRTKRYLEPQLMRLRASASSDIATHATGALKTYEVETGKAKYANFVEMAVDEDDPGKANAFLSQAKDQARQNAIMQGIGGDDVLRKVERDAASSIHYGKAQKYISVGNIDLADAYIEANASSMTVEHEVSLRAAMKGPLQERQAASDFAAIAGADALTTSDSVSGNVGLQDMFSAIRGQESGGRQFAANGKPLTSSKGAVGIMQVMPGTAPEAAKLAGVKWDEYRYRNDAAYNQQIGEAYFKEMLRQFKDPEMAAAAYNAGPGAVRKALAKGGDYLGNLPRETRDYVAKFRERTGSPQQRAQKWDKEDVFARVDAKADAEGWTFERRERAKEYADRHIAREEQLAVRRESAADDAAKEWMLGRRDKFTDTGQIPGSIWANMSIDARLSAEATAKGNRKPVEPAANSMDAIRLHAIQYGDPDVFAKLDLSGFIGKITRAELDAAVSDQARLRGPGGDKTLQSRSAIATAISYQTAFDPAMGNLLDKKANPENYARVARDMENFIKSVTGGKREPTAQEIDAAWKRAVMPVAVPSSGIFGRSSETKPRFAAGSKYQVAVPISVRERIIASWKNTHAGQMPPDGVIGDIYVQNKGKPGFWE